MSDEAQPPAGTSMQVDATLVRQLAEMLDETRMTEIEVQDGDRRIRVARNVAVAASPPPIALAAPASAPVIVPATTTVPAVATPVLSAPGDHPGTVRSPMVGTVYLAAEPGAAPFVAPGKTVATGETLLIVEAMKVMNPIVATASGVVRQVLVENGQPVEFDQPLVIVE